MFWSPSLPLDDVKPSPPIWVAVLSGAGLGLVWGIAARIWMRLISDNPEFSIAGTAAILVITTLFGAWTGLAFIARRRGWQGWKHYVPRVLAVIFFIPFGVAGGFPLMVTMLITMLGLTQKAVVNLWVLAGLLLLAFFGTDIRIQPLVVGSALGGAIAVTAWTWFTRRREAPWIQLVNTWLERLVRLLFLFLAAWLTWDVAQGIMADKPGLPGVLYIGLYFVLLYPLVLALRVGLEHQRTGSISKASEALHS